MRVTVFSQTHQRLDVALHGVVVSTQVGHEAEARHDDVLVLRLAVRCKVKCEKNTTFSFIESYWDMWFLHIGHEKSDELMDVVCRLEDASVVGQFLQHLQTLNDTHETTSQQILYHS